MHLFDINIPNKIRYMESETFTAGSQVTVVETEFCKIGLAICYDVRFPELALLMGKRGAKMLIYPGAFNMVTGPLHWELLMRSRALDNQAYTFGVCPARFKHNLPGTQMNYWGHSICVDPFGKVVTQADHTECI